MHIAKDKARQVLDELMAGLHIITAQTMVGDFPIMQKQKVIVTEMKREGM